MKEQNWFKRFLAGIGIGVGAAIPGVSGAAIALIFRVYESIINAIDGFTKHIKKSVSTLLPILIGILIAVILCVIVFDWAFEHCMFLLISIFAGFLIGSFPSVLAEVRGAEINKKNIITSIIGGVVVIALGVLSIVLGKKGIAVAPYFEELFENFWLIILLFVVGIIASVALTVPGFSGSLILLILGFYKPLIDFASKWGGQLIHGNFDNTLALCTMILVFGIGCLVGVVFVSKLMTKLLANHHDITYFAIIGFIVGSFFVLFFNYQIWQYYSVWSGTKVEGINPTMSQDMEIPVGILLIGITAFFSYMIVRAQNNIKTTYKNK